MLSQVFRQSGSKYTTLMVLHSHAHTPQPCCCRPRGATLSFSPALAGAMPAGSRGLPDKTAGFFFVLFFVKGVSLTFRAQERGMNNPEEKEES